MGGEVGVESTYGNGSRFWATLKFSVPSIPSKFALFRDQVAGLRLLVIDDNPKVSTAISKILRQMNFEVTVCNSGEQGVIEYIKSINEGRSYSVVIADLVMKDIGGIEVVKKIQEITSLAPPKVILLSNGIDKDIFSLENGSAFDEVIVKPVKPSDLFDSLMRLLGTVTDFGPLFTGAERSVSLNKPPQLNGRKILVVEDNIFNQKVAKGLLAETEADVDVASNGYMSMEMMYRQNYDLIFMDLQMPDLDGIETAKLIRKDNAFEHIPIVAMTANALPEDRIKCADAGMNDFIAKPIDPHELWSTLLRYVKPFQSDLDGPNQLSMTVDIDLSTLEPISADWLESISTIDTAAGLRRALGRLDKYESYLREFVSSHSDVGWRLGEALSEEKWSLAARIAHSLRGVAGHIGAVRVQATATRIEAEASRNLADWVALDELLIELSAVTNEIRQNLPYRPIVSRINTDLSEGRIKRVKSILINLLSQDDPRALDFVEHRQADIHAIYSKSAMQLMGFIRNFDFPSALVISRLNY